MNKFHTKDDFGILEKNQKIPYYSIKLTPEQAKEIEGKRLEIYRSDGITLFEIRNHKDELTGEMMFYVVFI